MEGVGLLCCCFGFFGVLVVFSMITGISRRFFGGGRQFQQPGMGYGHRAWGHNRGSRWKRKSAFGGFGGGGKKSFGGGKKSFGGGGGKKSFGGGAKSKW